MRYSNLPKYDISNENLELISFTDNGTLAVTPAPNAVSEITDFSIVMQVLANVSPDNTLANHVSNTNLHTPVNDSTVSSSSTWSSQKIQSSINGSTPWLSLDNVPEGVNNLYFTPERALDVVNSTSQGITTVDQQAIATQLAAVLLGFNQTSFRYNMVSPDDAVITIDGFEFSNGYVDVTPGAHEVVTDGFVLIECDVLGHQVNLSGGSNVVITPQLSLDSFKDGDTNKLFSEDSFSNSQILTEIDDHINTNFSNYHVQINDNSSSSLSSTWSTRKIIQYFYQEFNSASPMTSHKELAVMHERAGSGSMPSSYVWTTDDNPDSTHTHYIKRLTSTDDWNENITTYTDEWFLDPGTWFIYWDASEDIVDYFTNITNVRTYVAFDNSPKVSVLDHPGVYTASNRDNLVLVTTFTSDEDYSSTYRNAWLKPRNLPGVDELYSIVHIERIR